MSSCKTKVVGLIGVGVMGKVMIGELIKGGYQVLACDPAPAAQEYAKSVGATVVDTPKNVAEQAEVILMVLPAPKHIKQVVTGEGGLQEGFTKGQIVVDLSTVDPGTTREMSELTAAQGVTYLDAPILGRPASIGRWVLPVGGDSEALERCRPVLETFASKAVHVGPSGAGHTLKLLNQLMFSTINAVTAEIMTIAQKSGISPKVVFETVSSSGAATVSGLFCEVARKIVEQDFDAVFTVDLLIKDAGLGIEMAKSCGAPSLIAGNVQILNEIAHAKGLGNYDTSALSKVFEDLYSEK